MEDPAAARGDDVAKRATFRHAFSVLQRRVDLLVNLNSKTLGSPDMKRELQAAGETQ